ncbi:hypothetical protein [uncultured Draconibacterium sp.]|uniref:hypothetical protein n=1 Tax=uncultured Draconibacterium sp. TaxID=1573823 RepID=UPI003216A6A2
MYKYIFLVIGTIVLLSCSKSEVNNSANENRLEPEGSTTILFNGSSVYAEFFSNDADREVGYYSTRANINDRDLVGFDRAFSPDIKSTQNKFTLFANGVNIKTLGDPESPKSGNMCINGFEDLFGKTVRFGISSEMTKSGSTSDDDISMYVPYIIDINYPVASATELQPLCLYDDFALAWNKDENNGNGVVVIVEWDGEVLGAAKNEKSVRTIDIVEDSGTAILNPELFNDIPDLAMVNITILRGNISVAEIENTAVKIYAASNSSILVVVAKETV